MARPMWGTIYVIKCPECGWHKAREKWYRKDNFMIYKCTRCGCKWKEERR